MGGGSAVKVNSAARWWQMLGHGAKFGHKTEQAIARCCLTETWMRRPRGRDPNTLLRWTKEPDFDAANPPRVGCLGAPAPCRAPCHPASHGTNPQTPRRPAPKTVAHFAKPARIPRRERAEYPKTILKTARRTVKPLNKGPNFRMVDTYATPFLFQIGRASCRERV